MNYILCLSLLILLLFHYNNNNNNNDNVLLFPGAAAKTFTINNANNQQQQNRNRVRSLMAEKILSKKGWTMQETNYICNHLEKSQSLIRCKSHFEDLALPGKLYLQQALSLNKALNLTPVVFLPGFGGSGLEAKLSREDTLAWYCVRNSDWFQIWLSLEELFVQNCWSDNLVLSYNAENNTYHSAEGVDIRGIDFGGIKGVAYLDYIFGFPVPFTSVYSTIIESLKAVGYEPGKNLRGAPFDWRYPPDHHLDGFYPHLKELIEDTFEKNNQVKVNVVTHSMGGPTFTYFLNNVVDKSWKEKYISTFIAIAGPWAGSPKALRSIISGDNFGLEFLGMSLADEMKFRKIARTSGGLISLLPDPFFWASNETFVITPHKNYTSWMIEELFEDLNIPDATAIYKQTRQLLANMTAPQVHTHCLYGTGNPTEFTFTYGNPPEGVNWYDQDPVRIDTSDQGDGTVPLKSLQQCQTWSKEQSERVEIKEFDESDHVSVLQDKNVVQYILDVITRGL